MKKIYILSLLLAFGLNVSGQSTRYVYATGATSSYKTGACSMAARSDDDIHCIPMVQRGYAVFDLATGLPAGAVITDAQLGFYVSSISASGGAGSIVRGYNGDMSTITVAATLYGLMTAATTYYSATWPATGATDALLPPTSSPATSTFLQACYSGGGFASMIWASGSGGSGFNYHITGETGAAVTTGDHAPFLYISYDCAGMTPTTDVTPAAPCANAPFTITSGTAGAVSYSWQGPGGFSSTLQNPPAIAAGLATSGDYTLTVVNAAGCDATVTLNVPIIPLPSSAISVSLSEAFCTGDNAALTVPFVGTNTYQWYNNSTLIPGATNSSYTSFGSGNFTAQVTDAAGCTSTTAAGTPIVLLDTPRLLSPVSPVLLCPGDNGTLTVNTNGVTTGISFQWQKDGTPIPGAITPTYVATVTGSYNCTMNIAANGCTNISKTDTVLINTFPTPVISNSGGILSTSSSFSGYQWYLNTAAVPGATNSTLHPSANGSYRVLVANASGCTGFSSAFPFATTGVGQMNKAGVNIYPNPASSVLHIEAPEKVRAVVCGLEGKILLEQANASEIDISGLASGLYFISLYNETGERIAVQKITKE